MAEEKQSNTYTIVVAVSAVLMIAFVLLLKGRETEHLAMEADMTVQQAAAQFEGRKDFNNVME